MITTQQFGKSIFMSVAFTSLLMGLSACSSKLEKAEAKPAKLSKMIQNESVLRLKWSEKLGGGNRKDPLRLEVAKIPSPIDGSTYMYVASTRDGDVVAMNDLGKRLWSTSVKHDITSGVSANTKTVVVVDDKGVVHAFNPINGDLVWKKQLTGSVLAPALINDAQVVVTANDGMVTGIDSGTGQTLWNFSINVPQFSLRGMAKPIELASNLALVAGSDGRVHAMRTESGVPLWARRVGISRGTSEFDRLNDIDADPVFYDFTLYTASFQGQVVAVDMKTRQERFQIPVSSTKTVGVNADSLFVSTTDGLLNAYNRISGKSLWSMTALKNRKLSNPVVVNDNTVIVGDLAGYLHSIDTTTGKYLGRVRTSGAVSQLQVKDGELLVQTDTGTVSVWQAAS